MTGRLPIAAYPISELRKEVAARLASETGLEGLTVTLEYGAAIVWTAGADCPCITCTDAADEALRNLLPDAWITPTFIVCETCGNKRCPHATHHDNACTRSNQSGQEGSVYQ